MMYVKADDESILPYGEEVQRRQTAFLPLDLSTVVLGIGISRQRWWAEILYVKADDESILSYGEEVQRRRTAFMPLDLSTVVLGIGIRIIDCMCT